MYITIPFICTRVQQINLDSELFSKFKINNFFDRYFAGSRFICNLLVNLYIKVTLDLYVYFEIYIMRIFLVYCFKMERWRLKGKENRIYIRGEFRHSLGMNFFSPFQSEREFKVYKSCKCSQIICRRVHKYSMFPRLSISISNFLKLLNKLHRMN